MCGRFTLTSLPDPLIEMLGLESWPEFEPRHNIAPTQDAPVVLAAPDGAPDGGPLQLRMMRWGLIPSWTQEQKSGALLINARCENAAEKPSYRSAFKNRRCLMLADGFYDWKRIGKRKQPYYFTLRDRQPFAFAALWERWTNPDGQAIETCALLTTEPNELMRPVHDRMPVILAPQDYRRWLGPPRPGAELLSRLFEPYASSEMACHPVGAMVNNSAMETPDCIEPLPAGSLIEKNPPPEQREPPEQPDMF
ncbi:MAG: SOS response-associated peptidase [Proteobacteria bacterium]|nr:SOS response-associated peptidase [Pseudomonadota bacterium]